MRVGTGQVYLPHVRQEPPTDTDRRAQVSWAEFESPSLDKRITQPMFIQPPPSVIRDTTGWGW